MSRPSEPNGLPSTMSSSTSAPTVPTVRHRSWWLRAIVGLLVAVGLVIGVDVGWFAYRRHRIDADLQAAVADLDQKDPGWRINDLEAARLAVPDNENSALVLIEANRRLPKDWQGWPQDLRSNELLESPPERRLSDDDVAYLRSEMAEVQASLAKARTLAVMPKGRYPLPHPPNGDLLDLYMPDLSGVTRIRKLLEFDEFLQSENGDLDGALRSCRAQLNAARAMGDAPFMICNWSA